jgi:hypothetical protein
VQPLGLGGFEVRGGVEHLLQRGHEGRLCGAEGPAPRRGDHEDVVADGGDA